MAKIYQFPNKFPEARIAGEVEDRIGKSVNNICNYGNNLLLKRAHLDIKKQSFYTDYNIILELMEAAIYRAQGLEHKHIEILDRLQGMEIFKDPFIIYDPEPNNPTAA